ncbi:MAG: YraN family protein [Oscillospiraceae bacterium]|nr:YraN family protein [Oscillospiraceae bacterium]
MTTLLLGKWGEATAAEYLRKKKFAVIAANFRTRFGEIDLIAENRKTVVFVEVKLRKNEEYGLACEFVTPEKQRKIKIAAESWLLKNPTEKELRFDVIEIYAPQGISQNYKLNHIENAF